MNTPPRLCLALAGPFASGKSTIAHWLELTCAFSNISTRNVIKDYYRRSHGAEIDDLSLVTYGQVLYEELGVEAFNDLILDRIGTTEFVVIDSIRHYADLEYFRERIGNAFHLVFISAEPDDRLNRFKRRTGGRQNSEHAFSIRGDNAVEREVPLLEQHANLILSNDRLENVKIDLYAAVSKWARMDWSSSIDGLVRAVTGFHHKHGFDVNTGSRETMHYRIGLMVEELGEIHQVLSKGTGDIAEEHADLLILLIGNCITMGIDIEEAFWEKFWKIMERRGRAVGGRIRVSHWQDVEQSTLFDLE